MSDNPQREGSWPHRIAAFLDHCCEHFFLLFFVLLIGSFLPNWRHPYDTGYATASWADRIGFSVIFATLFAPFTAWRELARRKKSSNDS